MELALESETITPMNLMRYILTQSMLVSGGCLNMKQTRLAVGPFVHSRLGYAISGCNTVTTVKSPALMSAISAGSLR